MAARSSSMLINSYLTMKTCVKITLLENEKSIMLQPLLKDNLLPLHLLSIVDAVSDIEGT